jgi:hypothetical protein
MPKVRKLTPEEIIEVEREHAELIAEQNQEVRLAPDLFDQRYPYITAWVLYAGWIEIGYEPYTNSFIRVLDTGGLIWGGEAEYPSLDAALADAEENLEYLEEAGEI